MSKASTPSELRLVANPITRPQISCDPQQLAAIAHRGSPLIIRGATGTGKTTTLIECAINRIASGTPADSILILTFGRERASEIRDAVVLASDGTVHEPVARTFHALAYSILSMTSGENFRETVLISGAEQEAFIKSLLQGNLEDKVDWWPADLIMEPSASNNAVMGEPLLTQGFIRELRDLMMRATERGLSPDELAEKGKRLKERFWGPAAQFWRQYLQVSAAMDTGAGDAKMRIDPSEIINAAIAHLNTNPALLQELRKRFTTIMVDEFHETDPAQRRLLELLIGSDSVFVVDPQSSVGRFRGSDPDGVDRYLADRFSGATTITLVNAHRGAPVKFAIELRSEAEEAQYIAYSIKRAHLIEGIAYSDMVVIVRAHNTTATAIRRALGQSSIPVAGDREAISSNAAIAPFILLARVATGIDALTLENCERLLLSEFGGATSISLRRIRTALLKARDEELDPRSGTQMIIDAIDNGDIPIEEDSELRRVHGLLAAARASLHKKNASIHDLLWAIWSKAVNAENQLISEAWQRAALRGGSRGAAADRDLDAMVQLFDSAARHIDRMPGAHPKNFLNEIAQENIVADLITMQGVRPDVIELMTVHSAKGLQFKRVFVAGIQEGTWPNLKQRSTLLGAERLVERERHGEDIAQVALDLITAQSLAEDEKRLFHVATTRASEQLHITAVTRDEDSPSSFFLECAESEEFKSIQFNDARPLTANALVASLRRSLSGAESGVDSGAAASLLATLAASDISVADPDNWLGAHPISSDSPLFTDEEDVYISPSAAESFETCGLKWLLERNGGSDGDSTAQLLGSVIHEYARIKVEHPDTSDQYLYESLDKAWPLITDSTGWISKFQLQRAQRMLERFAQYHRTSTRSVEGVELDFTFKLGKATVRGSVDRLEVDSDGKFYVVDFKTGKAIGKKEAAENLQLACYQLAVVLNGFEKKFESPAVSGSHLVFLGHETKEVATRERPPIDVTEVSTHLEAIADQMASPVFIAKKNDFCSFCPVKSSCPVHLQGRSVIG